MSSPEGGPQLNADERLLAELGYKQELERSWGGFTNFAISFSIISILAGCFTNFFAAWNNGGPVMVAIGWPVVSVLILVVALCMSEIVSSMPTAGGIYYWASKLGGPGWGWFTGWFNLVGLIGVVASVDYACASFISYTYGLFSPSYDAFNLKYIFIIYLAVLAIHVFINLFPAHILSVWNNTSAYIHVIGPAIVVLVLIFGAEFAPERLVRVHALGQQLRILGRHIEPQVLPVRGAAGRHPDPVHDHRLRRLGAPFRGDHGGGQGGRSGHVAVGVLLGHRRLDRAAGASCSRSRTRTSSRPPTRTAPAPRSASSRRRWAWPGSRRS